MHVPVRVCSLLALAACNAALGLDETVAVGAGPRTLVFDNRESATDLVDFPVAVTFARTSELGAIDPARDLRFFDPDTGRDLPFDVERWEPAGDGAIWVRVPQIDARSQTDHIVMFVGADIGAADPAAVWAGHDLVVHGVRDGVLPNAAGPAFTGRGTGLAATDGIVGEAVRLPAFVELEGSEALLGGWPAFTLELWMYPDHDAVTAPTEYGFLDRGGALNLGRIYDYDRVDGIVRAQIDLHFADGSDAYLSSLIALRRWFHVVFTFDGTTLWLYRNGVFDEVQGFDVPTTLLAGASTLSIGHRNPASSMAGAIDELRLSRSYRDADWIYAQYLTMTGRFVTVR